MILVVADVYVKDGMQDKFIASAKKCVDETVKETGNISYELNANAFDKCKFTFVENWESMEALQAHMEQEHFKALGGEIKDILAKELEIKVYDANKIN